MPRRIFPQALVAIDLLIAAVVPVLALYIRLEGNTYSHFYHLLIQYLPVMVLVRIVAFALFGLYNRLWRYASINELLAIVGAVTLSSVFITAYMYYYGVALPRSIHIISWLLHILLIGSSRMFIRVVHQVRQSKRQKSASKQNHVLIIGAGDAGAMIAREMLNSVFCHDKQLIGFVDDAPEKKGLRLYGVRVLGNCKEIRTLARKYDIKEIIIAMPSVTGPAMRDILQECKTTGCEVKTLPGIYEMIDGKVTVQQLRHVEITDLLRRDPVKLDLVEIAGYLSGKRVLITGAGGSIGSELCRQVAKMLPSSIVLLGKGENSIYEIHYELQQTYRGVNFTPVIADVKDAKRMEQVFAELKPQIVFHAAAHKHVPLMEAQPVEAVKNNIFGTKTVAEAADRHRVEMFVMISTDKAVNPTSVMGATKRVAELIIQQMNRGSKTRFMAVRFGNVLGSRGSVIPLFKKQIAQGGPITITHPEMRRYFMTIPEAVQLVLQAGAIANGGEVFVLDMGEPVKIVDMACDLIELSGLQPHADIKIKFTGLRPGEKLFEELLTAEEGTTSSKHEKIYVANIKETDEERLQCSLMALKNMEQEEAIIEVLRSLISTYRPDIKQSLKENKVPGYKETEPKSVQGTKYDSAVGFGG